VSRITCFWLEPVDQARRSLRRYRGHDAGGAACPFSPSYHNASVIVSDSEPWGESPWVGMGDRPTEEERSDPRGPARCACGYEFQPDDEWQVNHDRLYRRSDTGDLVTTRDAPAGAMWDATWWPTDRGPDDRCLVVKTPGGDWMPDCPSKDGAPWTRTGEVPKVTARPSILFPSNGYHAFLTNGVLKDC